MSGLSEIAIVPEEIVSYLKKNIQLKEIYEKILAQRIVEQACQERDITLTPEEIQAEAEKMRREKRLEKAADTLAWLKEEMLAPDDWEAGIRDHLLSQKLAKFLFDKEIQKVFAQNKIDYEQVSLYQIVVSSDKLAQELFFQLEEREISFYEAAHLYDIDEKRRCQCGYEGKLQRWKLKADLAAAIFTSQPGEVVGPIQIAQSYHLLMVEEFIPAELTPETYQEIIDRMFKQWLAGEINYLLHSQTS